MGLQDFFQPKNDLERHLIESMARSQLKMKRYEQLEVSLFEEWHTGRLIISSQDRFELILKYKQSIEATYFRALASLMKLREAVQLNLFESRENAL